MHLQLALDPSPNFVALLSLIATNGFLNILQALQSMTQIERGPRHAL